MEGYSAELVERALAEPAPDGLVLDPFGGSGTTALAAAMSGRDSVFAEVNPYLAWIADVKVNQARMAASSSGAATELRVLASELGGTLPGVEANHPLLVADRSRGYFPGETAQEVLGLLALIDKSLTGPAREIARLAVASSVVPASRMVRRTDLRKRTPSDAPPVEFRPAVAQRLRDFAHDIDEFGASIAGTATHIARDVRGEWADSPDIAVVVTSPPYLNGTNYCRNTKLELLALGFMAAEKDLKELRVSSISAGINNVSRQRVVPQEIDCVEPIARRLDEAAYDPRIPMLVRTYFADMQNALAQVRRRALAGAHMYFDIGDSRYCGVYVPTHSMLREIASSEGWRILEEKVIRSRRSYDGSQLTQVLLHFEAC
ncbi:DNA methyltransferase [Mycobacterium heckeshornense]|uniref:DNA methyltransferase n=1 Tax=Mycobacterium heckeshornense TaxID=110505 RepID=UPI001FD30EB7|nr:DNA methyltransferase [Mycobacterium heckeshornense]